MGNQANNKEENKSDQKEYLDTEEIPPDTQINNENRENHEIEVLSEQVNQENKEIEQVQQNQQQNEQKQENQEQQDGEVEGGEEEGGEEEEEEGGEEGEKEKEGEEGEVVETGGEGEEGEEEQQNQIAEEVQQPQLVSQEGEINVQGQQYQFVKDGQLYLNKNGQIYKVIQETESGEEMNIGEAEAKGLETQQGIQYQNEQNEEIQIAQPIFQYIDQNQQIQQIQQGGQILGNEGILQMQQNTQYLGNMGVQQYQQIQQSGQYMGDMGIQQNKIIENNLQNAQYPMRQVDIANYQMKNQQKLIQKIGPMDKSPMMQQSPKSKTEDSYRVRKGEPKDSIPKLHIISNRGSMINSQSQNSNSFLRMNLGKNAQKNIKNKYYGFGVNKLEKQILKTNQANINTKDMKNFNRISLSENERFVEIPRKEYDNYMNKETIFINDGMETGEYKFIGAKTLIKETEAPNNGKYNINEEEIIQEINRRNKANKEKKVTYELIDKFYALIEVRGKTIKRLDKKSLNTKNKTKFYATLENNNINTNINTNITGTYSNNYEGNYADNLKGTNQNIAYGNGNSENNNFRVGGGSYKTGGQFQGAKTTSGARGSGSGAYYEFRSEIPFTSNSNFTNFNNINSITSMPTDNYSKYIIEQINRIRIYPQSFLGVIEDAKANITKDRFGRLIYNGKKKIALATGEPAFNEAIEFLKNADTMEPLKYISYLTIIPPQNEREIKDKDDLNRKVTDMINGGINIKSYWRDVIKDPEISFLLMIVDDNGVKSGMRRRDILNPNMKYIGISSIEINRNFVCYITLS